MNQSVSFTRTNFRAFLFVGWYCFALLLPKNLGAQSCVFDYKILASNDPFGSCPVGTDSIIIRDTLVIDVSYEPLPGNSGLSFDGVILVDGGVLYWSANAVFRLGPNACIRLKNGGHIYPEDGADPSCNASKSIYFDWIKYASCNGGNALHTFSEVNVAGCANCCDSPSNVDENFGNSNELASAQVSVIPNPSRGDFVLRTKGHSLMKSIELLDLSGHSCAKFEELNTNQLEVNLYKLPPGLYFARVMFKEGLITKKVVLH